MGVKQTLHPTKNPPKPFRSKKLGPPTKDEKALVAQFVADQPCEVTPPQVQALSKLLRRSREVVKAMIEQARENFVSDAERYVQIHKQATEAALESGTISGAEVAMKGAQWAMENISAEGSRIVDKAKAETKGSAIQIGIKIGGMNNEQVAIGTVETPSE